MSEYITHWIDEINQSYKKKAELREGDRVYFIGKPKMNRLIFKKFIKENYKDVKVVTSLDKANVFILPDYIKNYMLRYASLNSSYMVNGTSYRNIPISLLNELELTPVEFYKKYEEPDMIVTCYTSVTYYELIACRDHLDRTYHEIPLCTLMNKGKSSSKKDINDDVRSALENMIETANYDTVSSLLEKYNEFQLIKEIATQAIALYIKSRNDTGSYKLFSELHNKLMSKFPTLVKLFNYQTMSRYGSLPRESYSSSLFQNSICKYFKKILLFIDNVNSSLETDITITDVFKYIVLPKEDTTNIYDKYRAIVCLTETFEDNVDNVSSIIIDKITPDYEYAADIIKRVTEYINDPDNTKYDDVSEFIVVVKNIGISTNERCRDFINTITNNSLNPDELRYAVRNINYCTVNWYRLLGRRGSHRDPKTFKFDNLVNNMIVYFAKVASSITSVSVYYLIKYFKQNIDHVCTIVRESDNT